MNAKYYTIEKIADGRDSEGTFFMTVLIVQHKSNGSSAPVAWFNEPRCAGCLGGTTWKNAIRDLRSFVGVPNYDGVLSRLRSGERVNVTVAPGFVGIK